MKPIIYGTVPSKKKIYSDILMQSGIEILGLSLFYVFYSLVFPLPIYCFWILFISVMIGGVLIKQHQQNKVIYEFDAVSYTHLWIMTGCTHSVGLPKCITIFQILHTTISHILLAHYSLVDYMQCMKKKAKISYQNIVLY